MRDRLFSTPTVSDGYSPFYDFDGSGRIDVLDGLVLRGTLFDEVPAGSVDLSGPVITSALQNNLTPVVGSDGSLLASEGVFAGTIEDSLRITTFTASVDGNVAVEVQIQPDGSFIYDSGLATDGSADGVHEIVFSASDEFRNTSEISVLVNLDSQAPVFCLLYTSPSPRDRG